MSYQTDGVILIAGPDRIVESIRLAEPRIVQNPALVASILDQVDALPPTAWHRYPIDDHRGPDMVECAICSGRGEIDGQRVNCDVCDTTGSLHSDELERRYDCPACDSNGVIILPGVTICRECHGWGWLLDRGELWQLDHRLVNPRYIALLGGLRACEWAAIRGTYMLAWRRPDGLRGIICGLSNRVDGQLHWHAAQEWGHDDHRLLPEPA
jgi:hypothetical protein